MVRDLAILNQLGAGASAFIRAHVPGVRVVEIGTSPSPAEVDDVGATVLLAIPQHELTPAQRASPVEWAAGIEWVHLPSAGADPYPPALLQGRVVTCARGLMSVPIAEHVLATMLAFERGLPEIWAPGLVAADVGPLGVLDGRTLGIVGLGSIGEAIATRALAFGMDVVAANRSGRSSSIASVEVAPLDEVLARSDHLAVAIPLTAGTRHLFDDRTLSSVKPGMHLVNIARGAVIDQDALVRALMDGRIARASLDVTEPEVLPADHPLRLHPHVRLSPHVSWSGPGVLQRGMARFLANLDRWVAGQPLVELVNSAHGY